MDNLSLLSVLYWVIVKSAQRSVTLICQICQLKEPVITSQLSYPLRWLDQKKPPTKHQAEPIDQAEVADLISNLQNLLKNGST